LGFASAFTLVSIFATTSPTFTVASAAASNSILPSDFRAEFQRGLVAIDLGDHLVLAHHVSPSFTSHCAMRTSLMLSPGLGTLMSTVAMKLGWRRRLLTRASAVLRG
jgi:hypothetical protein